VPDTSFGNHYKSSSIPSPLGNLGWVATAAVIGFIGNEVIALMQLRVGRRIGSEAMVADGMHARVDGLTSLAVLLAVVGTWAGYPIVDPLIGIVIGLAIVGITRNATRAVWFRLMDAVDPELVTRTEAVIQEHEEIKGIQRLQLRWVGHRLHGEVVINVDRAMSLCDSADLGAHLNHHLTHELPNFGIVSVQVLPVD
jgi:cation diffusion facilitator family transporter